MAKSWMVNQDACIQATDGLKPFVVPIIVDGRVVDDVGELLFI